MGGKGARCCLRSSLSVSPPLPTPSPGPRFRPAPEGRQVRPDLTPETRPSCPALGLHLCGQEPPPPWQPQPSSPADSCLTVLAGATWPRCACGRANTNGGRHSVSLPRHWLCVRGQCELHCAARCLPPACCRVRQTCGAPYCSLHCPDREPPLLLFLIKKANSAAAPPRPAPQPRAAPGGAPASLCGRGGSELGWAASRVLGAGTASPSAVASL